MTADSTKGSHELSTLRSLAMHSGGDLCSKYIVQLLDEFLHQGPNGIHQCLVFELLGPTLEYIINDTVYFGGPLETETILRLSKQLLEAIAFLHEVGYIHGDISGRNIAFSCNPLSRMSKECLFEVLGSPEPEEVVRLDGKPLSENVPSQMVKAAEWVEWVGEDDEDIRIIDLGEAVLPGEETKELAQPNTLRAPETIFTSSFHHRLDLWRAGIVIYSLIFMKIPFHQYLPNRAALVEHMIDFVEELPTEWEQQWDRMQKNSGLVREPLTKKSPSSPSRLEQGFDEKVQEESLKLFLPVIQGLMRFRPSDRISLSQALDPVRSKIDEMKMAEDTNDTMDY